MSQQPDVVVGTGEKAKEYQCYSVILAHASPVLDAMLSSGMRESENRRIEFPDKDPADWEALLESIDTSRTSIFYDQTDSYLDDVINESNVKSLIPLFHELQMDHYLIKCDDIFSMKVIDWGKFDWGRSKDTDEIALAEAIELLSFCSKFDLKDTLSATVLRICNLLELFVWGLVDQDLFNTTTIKQLQVVLGQYNLDGERPAKKQRCVEHGTLCDVMTSFVNIIAVSDNIMNDNEMFVNLIHYSLQSQHLKMKSKLEDVEMNLADKVGPCCVAGMLLHKMAKPSP